jgi:hypothetical protein
VNRRREETSELEDRIRKNGKNDGNGRERQRSVRVIDLDSKDEEDRDGEFLRAYTERGDGPELGADQAGVSIETLELTHEGLSREEL